MSSVLAARCQNKTGSQAAARKRRRFTKRDSATTFTDCSLSCLLPVQMDFVFESGGIKKVLFPTTVHSNQESHAACHTLTQYNKYDDQRGWLSTNCHGKCGNFLSLDNRDQLTSTVMKYYYKTLKDFFSAFLSDKSLTVRQQSRNITTVIKTSMFASTAGLYPVPNIKFGKNCSYQ